MSQEFEIKVLNIDQTITKNKLLELGAVCVHPRKKYVRTVYHMANSQIKGYCRIRDEDGRVYVTAKIYSMNADFPNEYEISINNSMSDAMALFEAIGIVKKAYHETYREKWSHPLAHEITFDTIPGIPTYMEIDCTTEENLNRVIKMLDVDRKQIRFGAYDRTYNELYGIPHEEINDRTPSLTFANIMNEINPRKNHNLLEKISQCHNNQINQ